MGNDLMTLQSLATLGGASFATLAVGNTCQHVFGFNPRWLGLLVAELVMLGVAATSAESAQFAPYLIALINGTIVYSSAVGANVITGRPHSDTATALEGGSDGRAHPKPSRSFRSRWY